VIPEFAWDPRGERLLWSEAKINDGRRVDQGCVLRKLRADYMSRLRGVSTVDKVPGGIVNEMRQASAAFLGDPKTFAHEGFGCGGDDPNQMPAMVQETRIGRYVR
jgi:hypothetical protein